MRRGFVRLWRCTLDSEVMTDDWLCRLWVWCLLMAGYKETIYRGEKLLPGQFVTGRLSGAEHLKVSPSKFYRGLHRLQEIGNISLKVNSSWTTVTICNWRTYNDDALKSEQPVNSQRTADEQPVNTTKEVKKEIKKESKKEEIAAPPRPPRPRDELFDAVALITGSDPKASGSHIGRVCKALRLADPVYTPAEVLRLPEAIATAGLSFTLTLGSVEKYIGWVRTPPAQARAATTAVSVCKSAPRLPSEIMREKGGKLIGT